MKKKFEFRQGFGAQHGSTNPETEALEVSDETFVTEDSLSQWPEVQIPRDYGIEKSRKKPDLYFGFRFDFFPIFFNSIFRFQESIDNPTCPLAMLEIQLNALY